MAVNQQLHSLFVDLEKADESVPLKNLWKALEPYYISNSIIRAIKRLYEKSFPQLKMGNKFFRILYNKRAMTKM